MRRDYEVMIAGAGPGGATAAYELACRGVRVGVFEKQQLPRVKPCGGCLSLKIDRILDPDFHPLVERTIHGVRFTFEGLRPVHRRSDCPVAYMVMRDRFDAWLVAKARQAGAEVHEGEAVRVVHEQDDGVEVETTRGTYHGRFLVGADGATGVVARQLGLKPGKRLAVALEGEATVPPMLLEALGDEVWIEFGSIPYGYGWVFPKGTHLSVGIGGLQDQTTHPRDVYETYLEDEGLLAAIEHEERRGFIIPIFGEGRSPRQTARVLLVGDAAVLVDPFLGEGIYIAVDQSKGMLRQARKKVQDPRVTFAGADIRHLPYPDKRFDVAVCAWTLETLTQPQVVVAELLRVIKDDGYVIYAFASAPAQGLEHFYTTLVEHLMHASLRWRFLTKDDRPYHDCEHSSLATFARGLSTVVVLRKCCMVAPPVLPCLETAAAAT